MMAGGMRAGPQPESLNEAEFQEYLQVLRRRCARPGYKSAKWAPGCDCSHSTEAGADATLHLTFPRVWGWPWPKFSVPGVRSSLVGTRFVTGLCNSNFGGDVTATYWVCFILGVSGLSLIVAVFFATQAIGSGPGTAELQKIARATKEGVEAFVKRQYKF